MPPVARTYASAVTSISPPSSVRATTEVIPDPSGVALMAVTFARTTTWMPRPLSNVSR